MFVALLLSFYSFLIGPGGQGPQLVVDPGGALLQIIFISAAPALVLAGFVFAMARSFGTRTGGMLLLAAGIIMVAGMSAGNSMLPSIDDQYLVGGVANAPYIFVAGGTGIAAVGGYLLAISGRRAHYSNLDDLR
jgi:hypothetical protein